MSFYCLHIGFKIEEVLNFSSDKVLTAIEFSVESRLNPEDEQVTIIANPYTIKQIKIAIAEGKIFQKNYSQLIFNSDDTLKESELMVIPDHIIEEIIQEDIKNELENNNEVKEKMQILNKKFENIPEETLNRISTLKDEELTEEELNLKNDVQFAMLEVGMNLDLQFSNQDKQEEKKDKLLDKLVQSNKISSINLGGNNG